MQSQEPGAVQENAPPISRVVGGQVLFSGVCGVDVRDKGEEPSVGQRRSLVRISVAVPGAEDPDTQEEGVVGDVRARLDALTAGDDELRAEVLRLIANDNHVRRGSEWIARLKGKAVEDAMVAFGGIIAVGSCMLAFSGPIALLSWLFWLPFRVQEAAMLGGCIGMFVGIWALSFVMCEWERVWR